MTFLFLCLLNICFGLPPVFVPVGELVKTVESVKAFFLWLDHIITLDAEAVKGAAYLTYKEKHGGRKKTRGTYHCVSEEGPKSR